MLPSAFELEKEVKILHRNAKKSFFIFFWFFVTFKSKLMSIGGIFSDKFSFINS